MDDESADQGTHCIFVKTSPHPRSSYPDAFIIEESLACQPMLLTLHSPIMCVGLMLDRRRRQRTSTKNNVVQHRRRCITYWAGALG